MAIGRDELKQSVRILLKHRGFTAVAVLSLALAVALNTTMYSTLDALVNPRVALRAPDRLYSVGYWGDRRHRIDQETKNTLLLSGLHSYEALTSRTSVAWRALIENGDDFYFGQVDRVA